ncbi:MAG: DUF885 domain-containing protein [Erysipelotrichaceae bacterium]
MKDKLSKIISLLLITTLLLSGCVSSDNNQINNVQTLEFAIENINENVNEEVEIAFKEYLDKQWIDYLESDAYSLHMSVKDYSIYDLELPEQTWGHLNEQYLSEYQSDLQDSLADLKQIDRAQLSTQNQRYYDILERSFDDSLLLAKYPYHENYFSPSSGVTSNYLTALVEYPFYDEQDVKNYLLLLADLERFFDEVIAFTEIQISKGYFMSDNTLQSTINEIDKFISKVEDNELIVSFNNKITELAISNSEKYKNENTQIVQNSVIASYNKVKAFLETKIGTHTGSGALIEYDQGAEYYLALVRTKSSSEYSIEDLMSMMEDYLNENIDKYLSYLSIDKVSKEYEEFSSDIDDPNIILDTLAEKMKNYYPDGPETSYTATYLDQSITDDNVVAYYLIPPVDDVSTNVIKINPNAVDHYIDFYTTLAHEGYPGHLYQVTYLYEQDIHPYLLQQNYLGYTEGWAMKMELDALEWLDFENKETAELFKFDIRYSYILQAYLDLAINYFGLDVAGIVERVDLSETAAKAIINSVTEEPGQILPYGIGLLLFDNYEAEAKEALGDKFNIKDYHLSLLRNGFRSFEEVKKDIDLYLESQQ